MASSLTRAMNVVKSSQTLREDTNIEPKCTGTSQDRGRRTTLGGKRRNFSPAIYVSCNLPTKLSMTKSLNFGFINIFTRFSNLEYAGPTQNVSFWIPHGSLLQQSTQSSRLFIQRANCVEGNPRKETVPRLQKVPNEMIVSIVKLFYSTLVSSRPAPRSLEPTLFLERIRCTKRRGT